MLDCENIITYKKREPSEIIEVGDVIMIDPDNGYITKAVKRFSCKYKNGCGYLYLV